MFYAIRHFTRYRYSQPVWQSMMEVRMHPSSEGSQRCFVFQLSVNPTSPHFRLHGSPTATRAPLRSARAATDSSPSWLTPWSTSKRAAALPETMEYEAWNELDEMIEKDDYWDMLMPSHFARSSPQLEELAREIGAIEAEWTAARWLSCATLFRHESHVFSYVKKSTSVNSPIEDAFAPARESVRISPTS